jgi:hypothetical protein
MILLVEEQPRPLWAEFAKLVKAKILALKTQAEQAIRQALKDWEWMHVFAGRAAPVTEKRERKRIVNANFVCPGSIFG